MIKPAAVDVGQEVNVDAVEKSVDGHVVSFSALGKVASQPEHDLPAHGLGPEHAAEEGHVDLEEHIRVQVVLNNYKSNFDTSRWRARMTE